MAAVRELMVSTAAKVPFDCHSNLEPRLTTPVQTTIITPDLHAYIYCTYTYIQQTKLTIDLRHLINLMVVCVRTHMHACTYAINIPGILLQFASPFNDMSQ